MILGLLQPTAGRISLFSRSPRSLEARSKLGYLPELSYLHPFLTAEETIGYYAGLSGLNKAETRRRTKEILEMVGLADVAKRTVGSFSKGMARRVALASSLIGRPELLILDEPTSGLDPVSTKEVKTLIKALAAGGMTILMTSHLLADAEDVCDRVAIVNHGKVVAEGDIESLDSSLEDFFLAKVGDEKKFALAGFLTEGQRS
jgi:ABC-2 type transport system ATP-binding protein